MTEADRDELVRLEARMQRALDGDPTVEPPAGDELRRMISLQAARMRDDELSRYEAGAAGVAAAHAAARLRGQK
jgi:hypothetical protein